MLNKAQILFDSYNIAIERAYEDFFKHNKNEDILRLKEGREKEFLKNSIENWNNQTLKELNNQSPSQFVGAITDLNEALDLFKIGSKLSDKDLPEIFVNKLVSFGQEIKDLLLSIALDKSFLENDEDIFISIMAIRLLGQWKVEKAVGPFIALIYELNEEKEIVVEEIVSALINIGNSSTQSMIDILDGKDKIGYIDEYILSSLEKIGKDNKSDAVFKCLKDVFLKMEDKILGAMCLGDYGDGRAITALRGYLEKNKSKIAKETYNEVKAAIKRLGGSITDL